MQCSQTRANQRPCTDSTCSPCSFFKRCVFVRGRFGVEQQDWNWSHLILLDYKNLFFGQVPTNGVTRQWGIESGNWDTTLPLANNIFVREDEPVSWWTQTRVAATVDGCSTETLKEPAGLQQPQAGQSQAEGTSWWKNRRFLKIKGGAESHQLKSQSTGWQTHMQDWFYLYSFFDSVWRAGVFRGVKVRQEEGVDQRWFPQPRFSWKTTEWWVGLMQFMLCSVSNKRSDKIR